MLVDELLGAHALAQMSDLMLSGVMTNTTVSVASIRSARRFFQSSAAAIECLSRDGAKPVSSSPASSSSAKAKSLRE